MFRKLRNNIGAVILIAILGLILLGAAYVNVGPTTYFDGDVGVPAGYGYYINDVLLTYSDVNAQQADAALTSISGLTYVEDSFIKFIANDTYTVRTLAEVRTDLGLVIGTNVQAYDAGLTSLAGLTYASPSFIKVTATDVYAIRTIAETKTDLSLNYVENLKVKLDGTAAPGVSNDNTEGYAVGSRWIDITNDKEYVALDVSTGAAVWTETTGAGGGATAFTGLTDTPANYTGSSLKHVRVNVGETALEFVTLGGGGDMLKATYDTDEDGDIDVAAGGTEKSSWTLYAIPYLSGTTAFGEIPIGTAECALTVNAGANGYDWTLFDLSLYYLKTEMDSFSELQAIISDKTLVNTTDKLSVFGATTSAELAGVVSDETGTNKLVYSDSPTIASPTITGDLGGELDAGAHSIGFTLQSTTGDGTTTIDWRLGNKFKFTFGAQNETFTFTAPTNPCTLMLTLIQDATGSRTVTWPATVKWPGGTAPTLTTTANARDKIALDWDGTQYDGVCSKDFK